MELGLRPRISGAHIRLAISRLGILIHTDQMKHMHYTKGWEYNEDAAAFGSGALAGNEPKNPSSKHASRHDSSEVTEVNDDRPAASRLQSSKGKARAADAAVELDPETGTGDRSRSRSQRPRDPDSDLERNDDRKHHRRLREVRGGRRKRDSGT